MLTSFLRRIARRFARQDEPLPSEEQPIQEYKGITAQQQTIMTVHHEARMEREGLSRRRELTNVIEYQRRVMEPIEKLAVPRNQMLRMVAIVVLPTNEPLEVVRSWKTGTQWSKEREVRLLADAVADYCEEGKDLYDFLAECGITLDYFLVEYQPKILKGA